jgi:hypothetical protein
MWDILKSTRANVIMNIGYEDFATIEVEKMIKTNNVDHYVINIDIFDVYETSVDIYKLNELEKALEIIKEEIEFLYDNIPLYNQEELDEYLESFQEKLNSL